MSINLINLERVSKAYGAHALLSTVSLGIGRGDRIGVVGRNGDGKSTLLRLLAGLEPPDAGRVTHTGGLQLRMLGQHDELPARPTGRMLVLGDRADHEWASRAESREVVENLLAGVDLERPAGGSAGASADACRSQGSCWNRATYCSSTSPRTILTWTLSTGWLGTFETTQPPR